MSSAYLYEGNPTTNNLVGKPKDEDSTDGALALGKVLAYSWTPALPNQGTEFFQFEVAQQTIVTKIDIYQVSQNQKDELRNNLEAVRSVISVSNSYFCSRFYLYIF